MFLRIAILMSFMAVLAGCKHHPSSSAPDQSFSYDLARYYSEFLEDVGPAPTITSVSDLELVEFLKPGESDIVGETLVQRAGDLKANLGLSHVEWLLVHQDQIPAEWQGFGLVFPGTIVCCSEGDRIIGSLYWRDDQWQLIFLSIEDHSFSSGVQLYGNGGNHRLIRPRKAA